MIGQSRIRKWLGTSRQQAIARANVDPDLSRCKASVVRKNLNSLKLFVSYVKSVRSNITYVAIFVGQIGS